MQEKQDADIRKRLCQRKVLVLGPESEMKQKFLQAFKDMNPEISENVEDMSPGDYVVLFGFAERSLKGRNSAGKNPAERALAEGDKDAQEKSGRGGRKEDAGVWETFSFLTDILRKIKNVRPESVLFVSRSDVYGKLFGEFHPVKEDEMGYVCHTSVQDQEASNLRLLEHLCFRMAREDRIAVKIVRFPDMRERGGAGRDAQGHSWQSAERNARTERERNESAGGRSWQSAERSARTERERNESAGGHNWQDTGRNQGRQSAAHNGTVYQDWTRITDLAVKVLLDGAAGEAYNAEGFLQTAPGKGFQSAHGKTLQPIPENMRKTEKPGSPNGSESGIQAFTKTTALEPIRIIMDTGKAERLG